MSRPERPGKRLKCFASVDMFDMSEILQKILLRYAANDERKSVVCGERLSMIDKRALFDLKDCVLGYKALLALLPKGRKEASSDLALFARLMALPCHPDTDHEAGQVPLWAVCLPCHARRCLRLLHPLEPCLDLPQWLKRRARLVFYHSSAPNKDVSLCDLDPTVSVSKKKHKGSKFYYVIKTSLERVKLSKWVETVPVPDALVFPEPSGDQSSLVNDSTSSCASSSLRVSSESDSDEERIQKSSKALTTEKMSEVEPVSSSSQTTLRDRRSRRLTAKYAAALEEQTRRRRQRDNDSGTLGSPTVTLSMEEDDEENQNRLCAKLSGMDRDSQTVKSLKRSRPGSSPENIIKGKRKPKANLRLQGDYATLGPQGKWESGGRVYSEFDDTRSDISSSTISVSGSNRRQRRRSQSTAQQNRGGPRVKVVDRKTALGTQYSNPMLVMKHAAKLAAVGAQTQDGTSPLMAASAATAEAYFSDGSSADGSNRLRPDCGNCAACRGMVAPCGRCHNCSETICHRRRHLVTARGEGPRRAQRAMKHAPPPPGPAPQPSLLETVPGLQEQLMSGSSSRSSAGLTQPSNGPVPVDSTSSAILRVELAASASTSNLEVFADAPVRSLRGGDLGMHFAPHDSHNEEALSHTIAPVEGEVIDGDIAYRGGFPVVTSSMSAPPKAICYLCGSAGVDVCPNCTKCVHCLVSPRDREIAVCRMGNEDADMVPWSRDPAKCAACAIAEARGHICPQCNRTYLDETVEMIECDSCHRWLHRACAKLSYDQYELIARAPPNQLRSFTIYCSPCKQSIATHSAKAHQVDDDEKLRRITRESLTERMNTLIEGCKAFPHEPIAGPSTHLSFASPQPTDHKGVDHSGAAVTSLREYIDDDHLPQKELFFKWQRLLHHPNRRTIPKSLDEDDMLYYFGLKPNWQTLNEDYADRMLPLPPRPTVDLDESDPETLNIREIRALPMEIIIREEKVLFDPSSEPRRCLLCTRNTDSSIEDRLIYIGSDTWAHINCALWSKEVYEEDSGQLTGLSAALRRGGRTRCLDCGNLGATVTCSNTESCGVVVHFPCAMRRRRPISSRPVFTADRSFFCSPECYAKAKKARLIEAVRHLRLKKLRRFYMNEEVGAREEEAIRNDSRDVVSLVAANEISEEEVENIKLQVDCDLESPELKEMLVFRRVFVPSDCFIASMGGDGINCGSEEMDISGDEDDGDGDLREEDHPHQPVLALAISPSTLDFASHKLPASAFVITIGALRIDRLGHIGEASDSLCRRGDRERPGYLCPIGYRQGMPSNRLTQKQPVGLQQSLPSTPQKTPTAAPQTISLPPEVASAQSLSPLHVAPVKVVETTSPVSANSSGSNGSLTPTSGCIVQNSQPLVIPTKAPFPSPPKFANIVSSPQKASTPCIVSAVSVPNLTTQSRPTGSANSPKPIAVYSISSVVKGGVVTQLTPVQSSSSLRIIEKRTSTQANITPPIAVESKRPVVVRCVPGGPMLVGSKTPHSSVIVRQPERPATASSATLSAVSNKQSIRVTRLVAPSSTSIVTRVLPLTPSETSQIPASKLSDAQLASQLDGIFNKYHTFICFAVLLWFLSVFFLGYVRFISDPPSMSLLQSNESTDPPPPQQDVIRIPQISQLDGINDMGDYDTFSRRCGNNDAFSGKAKRRWMVERENRLALNESVLKARQAVNDRLYQKEATLYMFRNLCAFDVSKLPNHFQWFAYIYQYTPPVPVHEGAARLMPYPKLRTAMGRNQTRDPLDFLLCVANRAPQSCLPLEWPAEAAEGLERTTITSSSCIDAARQAASIVATSLNLSPRFHARTVEAAVAEATADIVEEAEDAAVAAAGRSRNQLSLRNLVTNREARLRRVAVYPSRIHKRGLFALCSFRPEELICEYTGELIRNIICERREAEYQASGVDCYFFRIDNDWVIDATYAGNYARFINHSCQPNCDAKTITMGDSSHIGIIAKRRIRDYFKSARGASH
ncbi:Histone-lysine N-methyltransferase MLL4 [Echinococcus granulosus]|uniref:Histone-lysine N-methyltransferase MLL4 n=1 Tax=Echinococcus granulosus TaxID=6210 RepID=W6USP5_ECHGR|nr:Histone-lysine N-methyltransferase MLL4 [Echinococcus granulosus]EUB64318.1 Histone-lysine N-methyltransferase MLL4 [Echinococcus granulosus]